MFIYRLKNEWKENRRVLLSLWVTLVVVGGCFCSWWFAPIDSMAGAEALQVIATLAALVAGGAVLGLTVLMFKRDDLKSPQAFWATRPIRSLPFFGAKLVVLGLAVVLPIGVLVTFAGMVAGLGATALWNALESMMWVSAALGLLAMACMAFGGLMKPVLALGAFAAGLMLPPMVGIVEPVRWWLRSAVVEQQQFLWNMLFLLLVVAVVCVWLCLRQAADKHRPSRIWTWAVGGFACLLTASFVPLPGGLWLANPQCEVEVMALQSGSVSAPYQLGHGRSYGREGVGLDYVVDLNQPLAHDEISLVTIELEVHDVDGVSLRARLGNMRSRRDGPNGSDAFTLSVWVLEGEGTHDRSGSWSGSEEMLDRVQGIPKRTVRVTGVVEMRVTNYRDAHRGQMDERFESKKDGMIFAYLPEAPGGGWAGVGSRALVSKRFGLPLITGDIGYNPYEMVRVAIDGPGEMYQHPGNFVESHRVNHALFGFDNYSEIRINDHEVESSYQWRELQKSGYDKSFAEWKQEAELIVQVIDEERTVMMPIDVEIEIPDPVKLREMMLAGEL